MGGAAAAPPVEELNTRIWLNVLPRSIIKIQATAFHVVNVYIVNNEEQPNGQ